MKEILAIITLFVSTFTIALIPVYFLNKTKCYAKTVSFEDKRFGLFEGCMVYHNDMFLPLENIRGFGDKN